jgi:hypothetical protein
LRRWNGFKSTPAVTLAEFQFLDFRLKLCQPPANLIFIRRLRSPALLNIGTQGRSGNRAEQGSGHYWTHLHTASIFPPRASGYMVLL